MEYKVFSNPKKIYEKMLSTIKNAKKEIFLETYIYGDDKIGRSFRDALVKKASEGVRVRVLVDAWGSGVRKNFFRKLILAGGEVRVFRIIRHVFRFFRENHERNHRKLLLVDGRVSYIGSINITSACLDWRELVLKMDGKIAKSLGVSFARAWKRFNLIGHRRMKKILYEGFEILHDSPTKKSVTERSYNRLIGRAKKEIFIETPYFVPSRVIRRAIKRAIKRGVRVVVLLPRRSDVRVVDIFRNRYLGALHRIGVEIRYYPKILHSKLLIIDDSFFLLGSSNLDYRSFRHQYEINILGRDKKMVESLKKYFMNGLRKSKVFSYVNWQKRHFFSKLAEKIIEPFKSYI